MTQRVWTGLDLASRPDMGAVVTIDIESEPGAWALAIAFTPHLAAQLHEITGGVCPCFPNGDGTTGGRPPRFTPVVPPFLGPEA